MKMIAPYLYCLRTVGHSLLPHEVMGNIKAAVLTNEYLNVAVCYRRSVALLRCFGGSAVSEAPLWAATSDKRNLAGLPSASPPLPAQVCLSNFTSCYCLSCSFSQVRLLKMKKARSWEQITEWPSTPFIFTAGWYCSSFFFSFLSISLLIQWSVCR